MKSIYVICRNGIPWRCYEDREIANAELVRLNDIRCNAEWRLFRTTVDVAKPIVQ